MAKNHKIDLPMPNNAPPNLVVRRSVWTHPANKINNQVKQHPLNTVLTCIAPDGVATTSSVLEPMLSAAHQYSITASPALFITQPFLNWFWGGHALTAVTCGDAQLHTGCVAAVLPGAQLHLQVTPEQYAALGTNGRVVHAQYGMGWWGFLGAGQLVLQHHTGTRYHVILHLNSNSIRTHADKQQRVRNECMCCYQSTTHNSHFQQHSFCNPYPPCPSCNGNSPQPSPSVT